MMKKRSVLSGLADWYLDGGALKAIGRTILILGIVFALVWIGIGRIEMDRAATAEREILYERAFAEQQTTEYKKLVKAYNDTEKANKKLADPAEHAPLPEVPELARDIKELSNPPQVKKSTQNFSGAYKLKYALPAVFVLVAAVIVGGLLISHDKFSLWFASGGVAGRIGHTLLLLGLAAALVIVCIGVVDMHQDAAEAHQAEYAKRYAAQQKADLWTLQMNAQEDAALGREVGVVPETAEEIVTAVDPIKLPVGDFTGLFVAQYLMWAVIALIGGLGCNWLFGHLDDGAVKTLGRLIVVVGVICGLVWMTLGMIEKNQAAAYESAVLYARDLTTQQERDFTTQQRTAAAAVKKGERPAYVPETSDELYKLSKAIKKTISDDNYVGAYMLEHALPSYVLIAVSVVLGCALCCHDRLRAWFTAGGGLCTLGRLVMVACLIGAVVIAVQGVETLYTDAQAEHQQEYAEKYARRQQTELKNLQKEAAAAEKAGEEPPVVPETAEEIVTAIKPIELPMEDYTMPFITGPVFKAVLVAAAGFLASWILSNIAGWCKAFAAGWPKRSIAGVVFVAGALAAAYLLLSGVWRVMQIESSTLPEIGRILLFDHVVWAVLALAAGTAVAWIIGAEPQDHSDEPVRVRVESQTWVCPGCGTENQRHVGACSSCGETKPAE